MSVCTSMECLKCKESVWIGQGGVIYTGMPEVMNVFRLFLQIHRNHQLQFVDDYNDHSCDEDWKRIDPENFRKHWVEHSSSWFWER